MRNTTLIARAGWGKKLSYCIAFSVDGAVDVTIRYVRSCRFRAPRNRCSESELLHILEEITLERREKMSQNDRFRLRQEQEREIKELRGYLTAGLVNDVFKDLNQNQTDGRIEVEVNAEKALEGRTNGNREFGLHIS